MPAPKYYEGQKFVSDDPSKPTLVYSKGRFFPEGSAAGGDYGGAPVMRDTKTDQEAIQTAREQADRSLDTATQAQRFRDLNRSVSTGPGMNFPIVPLPKFLGESVRVGDIRGVLPGGDKFQQMRSITSTMAPRMRAPGSGSSSDTDVKMFLEGVPSVDKAGPANEEIYKRLNVDSMRANARSKYLQTYYERHGSLLGADQAFNHFWAGYQAGGYQQPGGQPAGGAPGGGGAPPRVGQIPQRPAPAAPVVFKGQNGTVRLVGG